MAGLNRYPEPHPHVLAQRLAALYGVRAAQLLPGRGSDESIDLLVRGFCRAGVDNVIICPPTFGMYAVAARIQGADVREVPLRARARLRARRRRRARGLRREHEDRVPVLANNPTGNAMEPAAVEQLLVTLAGRALVVVDEAYIEFSGDASLDGRAGALSEPRRAAHLVEGLRPGRRARRFADRRAPTSSRCSPR